LSQIPKNNWPDQGRTRKENSRGEIGLTNGVVIPGGLPLKKGPEFPWSEGSRRAIERVEKQGDVGKTRDKTKGRGFKKRPSQRLR